MWYTVSGSNPAATNKKNRKGYAVREIELCESINEKIADLLLESKDNVMLLYAGTYIKHMEHEIAELKMCQPVKAEKATEKNAVVDFAVAVLAELGECAKQEDAPLYEGDREVDYFVRLSDVNEAINKFLS